MSRGCFDVFNQDFLDDTWNVKFIGRAPGLFVRDTSVKKKGTVAIANVSFKLHATSAICLLSDGSHQFRVRKLPFRETLPFRELSLEQYAEQSLRPGAITPDRQTDEARSLFESARKKSSLAASDTGRKIRHSIAERGLLFPLAVGACSVSLPAWVAEAGDFKDVPVVMHMNGDHSRSMSLLLPGDQQQVISNIQVPEVLRNFQEVDDKKTSFTSLSAVITSAIPRAWSTTLHTRFPLKFQRVVMTILLVRQRARTELRAWIDGGRQVGGNRVKI